MDRPARPLLGEMSEYTPQTLTQYLLGSLPEEQAEALENDLFDDDALFEQMEAAEDELIEAYLACELSGHDRARFEARFLVSERGRKKVAFARALHEKVSAEAPAPEAAPSMWARFKRVLWPDVPVRRVVSAVVAAAAVFVVAFYVVRAPGPVTVYPVDVRGTSEQVVASPARGALRLRLMVDPAERFTDYEILVRRVGEIVLDAAGTRGPSEPISLEIPAELIEPGAYVIELKSGGQVVSYYELTVP